MVKNTFFTYKNLVSAAHLTQTWDAQNKCAEKRIKCRLYY